MNAMTTSVAADPAENEDPMDSQASPGGARPGRIFITYNDGNACRHCGGTQFEGFMTLSDWPAISVAGGCTACRQMRVIFGKFRQADPSAPMIWWSVGDDVDASRLTSAPGYIRDASRAWGDEITASQDSIIIPGPVHDHYRNMGRSDLLTFDFDWQHYPMARRFDDMVGMMFMPDDHAIMRQLPGIVTDMNLFG